MRVHVMTAIMVSWVKEFISLTSFSVVEEGKTDVLVLGSTLDDKVDGATATERDGTDGLVDGTDDRANDDDIDGISTGDVSDVDTDGDDGDDGNDAGRSFSTTTVKI